MENLYRFVSKTLLAVQSGFLESSAVKIGSHEKSKKMHNHDSGKISKILPDVNNEFNGNGTSNAAMNRHYENDKIPNTSMNNSGRNCKTLYSKQCTRDSNTSSAVYDSQSTLLTKKLQESVDDLITSKLVEMVDKTEGDEIERVVQTTPLGRATFKGNGCIL